MKNDIHELGLSTRACNCLLAEGIDTVEKLAKLTFMDLWVLPNLGKVSIREIGMALAAKGIALYGFDASKPAINWSGPRSTPRQKTITIELTYWECMIDEHRHKTDKAASVCIQKTIRHHHKYRTCRPANPPK